MREASRIACLSGAIALGLLLSSCSDPAAEADSDPGEPGAIRGILRSGTADYFDEDRSEKVYALQRKDGSLVSLQFSGRPKVATGSEISVWGKERADGLHVERFKVVKELDRGPVGRGSIGQQGQGLHGNPPPLSPPLKAAFVSVSPAYTNQMLECRRTRDDFIKPVMEVSSYGRWTMEWDVYGPLTIPNDCGGTFYDNIGKNGVAAMKAAGIDTTQYQQIQFLLGSTFTSCSWGGFGWDGHTPFRTDGQRGQYNPWSYVKNDGEGVMVQEIGHNWGLAHEHFCPNTQTPTPTCSGYVEYGSPFTPMASGNNVYLNAWERIQMSFFSGCNALTVERSGTYEIGSISRSCEGPQVLRIKADTGDSGDFQRYYYLEYRTPFGIDKTDGVMIHYSADFKVGGWNQCDWRGPDCPEDWLINPMQGGTRQQALFRDGTQWTTPQGVGVKIVSLGDTAKFELTFPTEGAAPTCLEGGPWDNAPPVCKDLTGAGPGGSDAGTGCGSATDGGRPADSGSTADSGSDPGDAGSTGGQAGAGGGGTSGSGGSTGGSGGSTGGATAGTGGTAGDDKGCGCTVPGKSAPRGVSIIAAAAALGAVARWRRRERAKLRS